MFDGDCWFLNVFDGECWFLNVFDSDCLVNVDVS